jgi:two-component system chemotaxis response regulator CheB
MSLDTEKRNVVVIGASAGGVQALTALFQQLPASLPAAVLVVLHIPAHTRSQLSHILASHSKLRVVIAEEGQALEERTGYVASADRHLIVTPDGCVRVTRGPRECHVRPAIDVLFRSAAAVYGVRVIGVVLSGTLDDGTAGLWAIKERGGMVLVQDPQDAMYASMPESAIANVAVDFVGTIDALVQRIVSLAGGHVDPNEDNPSKGHAIENIIAAEGNGIQAGVMELGKVSKYTCPDCHGVLVQIEEGPIVRFRCHTGHAFSLKTLIAEVNSSIDSGLWDTLRAVEERVMLLRQMADLADRQGTTTASKEAARCRQQADDAEVRLKPLRELVLDPNFFGHDPQP